MNKLFKWLSNVFSADEFSPNEIKTMPKTQEFSCLVMGLAKSIENGEWRFHESNSFSWTRNLHLSSKLGCMDFTDNSVFKLDGEEDWALKYENYDFSKSETKFLYNIVYNKYILKLEIEQKRQDEEDSRLAQEQKLKNKQYLESLGCPEGDKNS